MQYKKLLKRNVLIKFWIFFGGQVNYKFNFKFINIFYMDGCYINYKLLLYDLKRVLPIFLNISVKQGKFLFVASKWLYTKSINRSYYLPFIDNLVSIKLNGLFSNFSFFSFKFLNKLNFKLNSSVIVFFYFNKKKLLVQAKNKNLPVIGLVPMSVNNLLIDYPLILNAWYFHSIFFF